MNTLQRLFDRLVGFSRYETELRHKAYQVYCGPTLNLIPLETPACWRRPARVQGRRRA
ncbi:hypothetical protein [Propionivibrio sp.]|uniref:hypothetical protein n=1 Tax=Propionivibrio sp. TaxID=2212460 RepID=UPI003BF31C9B